jgi:hypothetical protein
MGSAFSSNGKGSSSSLRKIGSAAALICFVLHFVVAGGVATLHRTDNYTPARGVLVKDLVTTTRVPRKVLRAVAVGARARRQEQPREQTPVGVRPQCGSSLEMEPSLAGDPERKHEAAPKPKSLLAIPVGIKNNEVVDKLVSKFPADDFTVMLFHYDGAVEQWSDVEWSSRAVHVAAKGQTKGPFDAPDWLALR